MAADMKTLRKAWATIDGCSHRVLDSHEVEPARNLLSDALDELEALRGANKRLLKATKTLAWRAEKAEAQRDELAAESKRLLARVVELTGLYVAALAKSGQPEPERCPDCGALPGGCLERACRSAWVDRGGT